VSFNPSRSRSFTTLFHCSSSKKELELILEAGDLLCRGRSSEEELLGPVVVVVVLRGRRVSFGFSDEGLSMGEDGVEDRWRRERARLLRLRRDFISREGMEASKHGGVVQVVQIVRILVILIGAYADAPFNYS
jgi:hypothetical protein